ncbi:hypothetical protein IWW51_006103, partial [Coemansia sp. RSA 2702]
QHPPPGRHRRRRLRLAQVAPPAQRALRPDHPRHPAVHAVAAQLRRAHLHCQAGQPAARLQRHCRPLLLGRRHGLRRRRLGRADHAAGAACPAS